MNRITINSTCIPFLDDFLQGGIPAYSLNVVAGLPGAGKTILVQHIVFNYLKEHKQAKVLYFTTISEPTLKIVRYLSQFDFFDPDIFGERIFYYDLHEYIVKHTLNAVADFIWKKVEEKEPALLVIDSFKAISDMVRNEPAFRLFCYNLSMRLATVRCTTFLVGEYSRKDMQEDSEFAVADGILFLDRTHLSGVRKLEVHKLRGQKVSLLPVPYTISRGGIQILGWRHNGKSTSEKDRMLLSKEKTGILGLDEILAGGFRRGQGVLVSGASGCGKTSFCLNLAYNYALQGKKVVYFSFEETPKVFESFYKQFGLDYAKVKSNLQFRHKFLTDTTLEEEMVALKDLISNKDVDVIIIDSLSMLLYKLKKSSEIREYCYYLQKCLYQYSKLGFFTSDIHFGKKDLSRSGAEETIFDGVIHLSLQEKEGFRRHCLEVYKLRGGNTKKGLFRWMVLRDKGMEVINLNRPLDISVSKKRSFFLKGIDTYPSLIVSLGKDKRAIWKVGAKFLAEAKKNKEDMYLLSLFEGREKVKETLKRVDFKFKEDAVKIIGPLRELEEDKELLIFTLFNLLKKGGKPARVFVPLLDFANTKSWLKLLMPILETKGVMCWLNLTEEADVDGWRPFADVVVWVESVGKVVELKDLQGQKTKLE